MFYCYIGDSGRTRTYNLIWSIGHYLISPTLPIDMESFISLDYVPCIEDPSVIHISTNIIEMLDGQAGEYSPDLTGEVNPFRECRHTVLNLLNLLWYGHNIPQSEAISYLELKAPAEIKLHCHKFGLKPGVMMALLVGSWAKKVLQQEVGAKSGIFFILRYKTYCLTIDYGS